MAKPIPAKELGGSFFTVPRHVIYIEGMTLQRLMVFEAIFQFWNKGQTAYMSNENLMERLGISDKKNIVRSLRYLEEKGLLLRKVIDGKRFLVQPEQTLEVEEGCHPRHPEGVSPMTPQGCHPRHHKILVKEEINKYLPPYPPSKGGSRQVGNFSFQTLLDIYARVYPEKPQIPIATSRLKRCWLDFYASWPQIAKKRPNLTPEVFEEFLRSIRIKSPGWALNPYINHVGSEIVNDLFVFINPDNVMKFFKGEFK
jgi:hypothetical protein